MPVTLCIAYLAQLLLAVELGRRKRVYASVQKHYIPFDTSTTFFTLRPCSLPLEHVLYPSRLFFTLRVTFPGSYAGGIWKVTLLLLCEAENMTVWSHLSELPITKSNSKWLLLKYMLLHAQETKQQPMFVCILALAAYIASYPGPFEKIGEKGLVSTFRTCA